MILDLRLVSWLVEDQVWRLKNSKPLCNFKQPQIRLRFSIGLHTSAKIFKRIYFLWNCAKIIPVKTYISTLYFVAKDSVTGICLEFVVNIPHVRNLNLHDFVEVGLCSSKKTKIRSLARFCAKDIFCCLPLYAMWRNLWQGELLWWYMRETATIAGITAYHQSRNKILFWRNNLRFLNVKEHRATHLYKRKRYMCGWFYTRLSLHYEQRLVTVRKKMKIPIFEGRPSHWTRHGENDLFLSTNDSVAFYTDNKNDASIIKKVQDLKWHLLF